MKTIFHIENRGHCWIFHWFIYMLSGFRHINRGTALRGPDGSGCYERNTEMYDASQVSLPYFVWMPTVSSLLTFQAETFDIIGDAFVCIQTPEINNNDIIINNYGERILYDQGSEHPSDEAYSYLRKLFFDRLPRVKSSSHSEKKYFIKRGRAPSLPGNNGLARRTIINEQEVADSLEKEGFKAIFLEDYSLKEKIEIFREAGVIVSPNTGGLVFTLFSNENQKILEMNVDAPHQPFEQYRNICRFNGVHYHKMITSKVDKHDNMFVNVRDLIARVRHL
jgi:hypothetical protein